jgi:hypothetical protein
MDFVSRAAESDRNLGPVPAFLHVSYTFATVTLVGQRWMVPAALSAALLAFRLNLKFLRGNNTYQSILRRLKMAKEPTLVIRMHL